MLYNLLGQHFFNQLIMNLLLCLVTLLIDAIVDLLTREEEELSNGSRKELRQRWQEIRMLNMEATTTKGEANDEGYSQSQICQDQPSKKAESASIASVDETDG